MEQVDEESDQTNEKQDVNQNNKIDENYKGIYFGDDNQKFHDKKTGAHFQYDNLRKLLKIASQERAIIDKKLGIVYDKPVIEDSDVSVTLKNNFIISDGQKKVILDR